MAWGDKSTNPVVYTPAAADAGGWALDAKIAIADGSIGIIKSAPRNGLVAEFLKGNWYLDSNSRVSAWFDTSANGYDLVQASGGTRPSIVDEGVAFVGAVWLTPMPAVHAALVASGEMTAVFRFKDHNRTSAERSFWGNSINYLARLSSFFNFYDGGFDSVGFAPDMPTKGTIAFLHKNQVSIAGYDGISIISKASAIRLTGSDVKFGYGYPGPAYAVIYDAWFYNRLLSKEELDLIRDLP